MTSPSLLGGTQDRSTGGGMTLGANDKPLGTTGSTMSSLLDFPTGVSPSPLPTIEQTPNRLLASISQLDMEPNPFEQSFAFGPGATNDPAAAPAAGNNHPGGSLQPSSTTSNSTDTINHSSSINATLPISSVSASGLLTGVSAGLGFSSSPKPILPLPTNSPRFTPGFDRLDGFPFPKMMLMSPRSTLASILGSTVVPSPGGTPLIESNAASSKTATNSSTSAAPAHADYANPASTTQFRNGFAGPVGAAGKPFAQPSTSGSGRLSLNGRLGPAPGTPSELPPFPAAPLTPMSATLAAIRSATSSLDMSAAHLTSTVTPPRSSSASSLNGGSRPAVSSALSMPSSSASSSSSSPQAVPSLSPPASSTSAASSATSSVGAGNGGPPASGVGTAFGPTPSPSYLAMSGRGTGMAPYGNQQQHQQPPLLPPPPPGPPMLVSNHGGGSGAGSNHVSYGFDMNGQTRIGGGYQSHHQMQQSYSATEQRLPSYHDVVQQQQLHQHHQMNGASGLAALGYASGLHAHASVGANPSPAVTAASTTAGRKRSLSQSSLATSTTTAPPPGGTPASYLVAAAAAAAAAVSGSQPPMLVKRPRVDNGGGGSMFFTPSPSGVEQRQRTTSGASLTTTITTTTATTSVSGSPVIPPRKGAATKRRGNKASAGGGIKIGKEKEKEDIAMATGDDEEVEYDAAKDPALQPKEGETEEERVKREQEIKRRNFLERNRQAAYKCRQKKKQHAQTLQQRVAAMQSDNDALDEQVDQLRADIEALKAMLFAHRECPVALANGLNVEALGGEGRVGVLAG
ncbi:hypothetical protein HDU67_000048 [Dinochytrium kinnereticum]|nr:hypothetical protein HDU67_000048 [Dinochytrium kinnereticum]